MVEADTNTTLVNPPKNRTDTNMQRGYIILLNRIKATGITTQYHILDNECSESMKTLIQQHCMLELVPPHFHRRNVAEFKIHAVKQHFLSIIAGVATDFSMHQWGCLLPQDELTLNLIRQSNTTPTVSAYAEMFGPFHYNRINLGPMGRAVLIHEKSNAYEIWENHAVYSW